MNEKFQIKVNVPLCFLTQRFSNNRYLISNHHQSINPNLGGGVILPPRPPSWFSLNNSKAVRAVTLESCSIQ